MYIKGENDYHFENSKMQNINPISKDSKQIKMTLIHFLIAHSIFSPYTWQNTYSEPWLGHLRKVSSDGLYWELS